jgi:hypothetical protein
MPSTASQIQQVECPHEDDFTGQIMAAEIHNSPNKLSACQEIAAPYNADMKLLVTAKPRYQSSPIDEGFDPSKT